VVVTANKLAWQLLATATFVYTQLLQKGLVKMNIFTIVKTILNGAAKNG
jgi:hypothetical protein